MLNKLTIGLFILLASLLSGCGDPAPPASTPEPEESAEVMDTTEGSDVPAESENDEETEMDEESEEPETESADDDSY
ncbi:hypothetical protein BIZ37_20940 [Photobacterium sp. BZF1]|uniref:hypothetical protein n=1 Tax=Photobacterium sp. BZF1 TaxID=1904457 RepID=UPI001653AA23|nr:hypothetical protein [Photobacterium sp. BZF1]MBC7005035.1 hypothetical protein [Photobacterium sp. BZF1]